MGEPADEDNEKKRPSGIPPRASEKRRVSLRPPDGSEPAPQRRDPTPTHAIPRGLGQMSTSTRRRLELALDVDSAELDLDADEAPKEDQESPSRRERKKTPVGLKNMTTSARHRLELAVEHDDEDVFDPTKPPKLDRGRLSKVDVAVDREADASAGTIPFDAEGHKIIRSLAGWIGFCGVITLGIGALTGLSYVTGEGSVAHVVVGILATAVSFWQLMAVWSLRKVLAERRQQHHMVHALGHIRSALLLKALLVCAAMVLGCFTFSIAGSLLFLLG